MHVHVYISAPFGPQGETARSERLVLGRARQLVLSEVARYLPTEMAISPSPSQLGSLLVCLASLPALLGVPASSLRASLLRDLVTRFGPSPNSSPSPSLQPQPYSKP